MKFFPINESWLFDYGQGWILAIEIINMHHIHCLGMFSICIICHITYHIGLSHYLIPIVKWHITCRVSFFHINRSYHHDTSIFHAIILYGSPSKLMLTVRCVWLSPILMIRSRLIIECRKPQNLKLFLMLINGNTTKTQSKKSLIKLFVHQIRKQ